MNSSKLDLKICEGCGALWLRATPGRVYCRRCTPLLADFPIALGLRRKPQAGAFAGVAVPHLQRRALPSLRLVSTTCNLPVEAGTR